MLTLASTTLVEALLWLCGNLILRSLGADMVEAIMKKSKRRNIMSVMDDMLKEALSLLRRLSAMSICYFAGSLSMSMKATFFASRLCMILSTFMVR